MKFLKQMETQFISGAAAGLTDGQLKPTRVLNAAPSFTTRSLVVAEKVPQPARSPDS
jgi:hypothetical protein